MNEFAAGMRWRCRIGIFKIFYDVIGSIPIAVIRRDTFDPQAADNLVRSESSAGKRVNTRVGWRITGLIQFKCIVDACQQGVCSNLFQIAITAAGAGNRRARLCSVHFHGSPIGRAVLVDPRLNMAVVELALSK